MNQAKKNLFWYITIFITGAVLLIIEVIASRLLAPYFGNTMYNTSSILGIVLAGLSIGYHVGGKITLKSKNVESVKAFVFNTILIISFLILLITLVFRPVNFYLSQNFNPALGVAAASIILFLAPSILFGSISTFVVYIIGQTTDHKNIGNEVGKIYSISTVGSIVGSFSAGYLLIPNFSIFYILYFCTLSLAVLAFYGLYKIKRINKISSSAYITTLIFTILFNAEVKNPNTIYAGQSIYSDIKVNSFTHKDKAALIMMLDGQYSAAKYTNSKELVFDYTKFYDFYKLFNIAPKKVAVVGGAAYTIPQAYLDHSNAKVDVYEIDKKTVEIANKYFYPTSNTNRLHTFIGDARNEMNKSGAKYDTIFLDAYSSQTSIPWHLTTQEYYKELKSSLNKDGIIISNIIIGTNPQNSLLAKSFVKTQKEVFKNIYIFQMTEQEKDQQQNIILIATDNDNFKISDTQYFTKESLLKMMHSPINSADGILLKDEFAPTDYIIEKEF